MGSILRTTSWHHSHWQVPHLDALLLKRGCRLFQHRLPSSHDGNAGAMAAILLRNLKPNSWASTWAGQRITLRNGDKGQHINGSIRHVRAACGHRTCNESYLTLQRIVMERAGVRLHDLWSVEAISNIHSRHAATCVGHKCFNPRFKRSEICTKLKVQNIYPTH